MNRIIDWMVDVSFKPARHAYNTHTTVSAVTDLDSVYIRKPFIFQNDKGHNLHGSLWYDNSCQIPKNCLIYLHSLGTNQFEVINLIPFMTSPYIALVSFDFPGCGISEGDYIPLDGSGYHYVNSLLKYLDEEYEFEQYALWGRSMGAAIALHSVSLSQRFKCCVSDSSYENIEKIVKDQTSKNGFPSWAISLVEPLLVRKVTQKLGTNIDLNYPYGEISFSQTPLLMGHGKNDTFVDPVQAHRIFDLYGCCDKQLYVFDARHNTQRPYQWYETASRFIQRKLGLLVTKRSYEEIYGRAQLHSGNSEKILSDLTRTKQTPSNENESEDKS